MGLARITPVSEPAMSGLVVGIRDYRSLVNFANFGVNVAQYIITLFVRGNQTQACKIEHQNFNGRHRNTQSDGRLDHPFWSLTLHRRIDRFGPNRGKGSELAAGRLHKFKDLRQSFLLAVAFEWQRIVVGYFKQAMSGVLMKALVGPRLKLIQRLFPASLMGFE